MKLITPNDRCSKLRGFQVRDEITKKSHTSIEILVPDCECLDTISVSVDFTQSDFRTKGYSNTHIM